MARTRAFSALRRSLRIALGAQRRGVPAREYAEQLRAAARPTRRELRRKPASVPWWPPGARYRTGLRCGRRQWRARRTRRRRRRGHGGLLCAYRLRQAGVDVSLFDAGTRAGGRMYTARGMLADGQLAELGGEFIDTDHATLRALARELDLQLDDLHDDTAGLRADTFYFDGRVVPEGDIAEAFVPVAERIQRDLADSEESDDAFAQLDAMSIEEAADAISELDPTLRALLTVGYVGEYGREVSEQSVFNLLWLIDSEQPDPFRIDGDSDERFHVHEGNDRIPTLLADALESELELERRLVRVTELGGGGFRLALDRDGATIERDVAKVVFALPWTQLRDVDLDGVTLSSQKRAMIRELGYGTNAKLMLQFDSRPWRDGGASGSAFTDNGVQSLWDTARGQSGDSGILTVFLGGQAGVDVGEGSAEERAAAFLPAIRGRLPGLRGRLPRG